MNLFELTAIITPLGGAISAGRSAFASGFWRCTLFSTGGFLLGLAIYFAAIGLSSVTAKLLRLHDRDEGLTVSLGGLLSLAFVMAAPFVAIFAAAILTR